MRLAGGWSRRTVLRSLLFRVLLLCGLSAAVTAAEAADLRVYCPSALREPMIEAARSYVRASGQRVAFVFASLGAVHKRVALGEPADVVIGSSAGIEALNKLGLGLEESAAEVARSALALAAPRGTVLPAPDDVEGIRRALASTAVLGVPDAAGGAPGAAQAGELLQALVPADQMQARVRPLSGGAEAVKRLADGGIGLAVVWMNEVAGVAAVEVSGPILRPPTRAASYAATVLRSSDRPASARAFIAHLRSAGVAAVLRRAGYVPVD